MTEFFSYENLTWPEIAELPRHTPLVIPLGEGYPMEALTGALDNPPRIGVLHPIPFGWAGSSLTVPDATLSAFISNLLSSLREDRFTHVYVLTPQDLNLQLEECTLRLSQSNPPRPPQGIPADSERHKVILIPSGHTEQHALHLPMNTDSVIIQAIAQGVAAAVPDQAAALPVMPYGVSTHRAAFAGTLNVGGRAFEDFWLEVIDILVRRGFERFYLISGHGGNCSFLTNVVKYAGERYPHTFVATAWLYLSGSDGIAALQARRHSPIGGMGHAGELETSLMLHLRPELVHMARVIDEMDFISTPSYYMDWVEGGALIANPPWEDDTSTGAYGAGSLAKAENGRFWLEAAITEKIAHVSEIHEQFERRKKYLA